MIQITQRVCSAAGALLRVLAHGVYHEYDRKVCSCVVVVSPITEPPPGFNDLTALQPDVERPSESQSLQHDQDLDVRGETSETQHIVVHCESKSCRKQRLEVQHLEHMEAKDASETAQVGLCIRVVHQVVDHGVLFQMIKSPIFTDGFRLIF